MFPKLVMLTVLTICLAGALLLMRQHRIELAHRAARVHGQSINTRHDLWDVQAQAAGLMTPQSLQDRIAETRLAFEPAVPQPLVAETRVAEAAR